MLLVSANARMSDTAIHVDGLSKKYRLGLTHHRSIRSAASYWTDRLLGCDQFAATAASREDLWAIRDISFEVKRGEVVGIIGRNGAGKSTLLKILSRITKPTNGTATLRGRVASLLEVGTGFHPELTGRENVYLNGTMIGMTRAEIKSKFDAIVQFAGVDDFIDTPVKRYSTGMNVRLGFAVAAHLEPEILIIDEVLAVGDAQFQQRCLGKLQNVARSGRTVLFVSHNMTAVQNLCSLAFMIDAGKLRIEGESGEVIQQYLANYEEQLGRKCSERTDRGGDGSVRVCDISVRSNEGEVIRGTDPIRFAIDYESNAPQLKNARFILGIYDCYNVSVFRFDTDVTQELPVTIPGSGRITCEVDPLRVTAGTLFVNVAIFLDGQIVDHLVRATEFEVQPSDILGSSKEFSRKDVLMAVPHRWSLDS